METESNPKWKRALWLALKIYAGLCTILITAYLAFVLWSISFQKSSPEIREAMVMSSYGAYLCMLLLITDSSSSFDLTRR
jgi:hypothetical protein